MTITQLITASEYAEHCQRNWDHSQSMPLEDVQALVDIAKNMPTKQNEEYYQLVVSVNPELNRLLYDISIDPDNPDTIQRNTQVDAHAVFVWFLNPPEKLSMTETENKKGFLDTFRLNAKTAIGISSGSVALSACHMGYRTGFNQCFEEYKLKDLLIEWGIKSLGTANNTPELILGVGIPQADTPWNHVLTDDGTLSRIIETYDKNIRYDIIK